MASKPEIELKVQLESFEDENLKCQTLGDLIGVQGFSGYVSAKYPCHLTHQKVVNKQDEGEGQGHTERRTFEHMISLSR